MTFTVPPHSQSEGCWIAEPDGNLRPATVQPVPAQCLAKAKNDLKEKADEL